MITTAYLTAIVAVTLVLVECDELPTTYILGLKALFPAMEQVVMSVAK